MYLFLQTLDLILKVIKSYKRLYSEHGIAGFAFWKEHFKGRRIKRREVSVYIADNINTGNTCF